MVDRLAMLEKMAAARPQEPFPQYGLAMEYRKLERYAESWEAFELLIERHPDYVPSYLMAGNLLAQMGRGGDARALLQRGIAAADAAGDDHARGEIEAAIQDLAEADEAGEG